VVLLMPAAALAAGLPVVFGATPRWTGVILLAAFGLAIAYLVAASRHHRFVESAEVREASEKQRSIAAVVLLTIVGIALIAAGGALVAYGADGIIHTAGLSAGIVGMVITPAAIEAEEIIRQVVPAQRGYADVSAGNVVGTVLYFLLFNLGLISLFTPVAVSSRVRFFDWPFLVASAVAASLFLVRGRVNRLEGAALAGLGVVYVALHVLIA
jgi:cation:H+ antiporter